MTHALEMGIQKTGMPIDYLCVSTHDLAGLLVDGLAVPVRVHTSQCASQAVMFPHEQCVNACKSNVLVHTDVTFKRERQQI